MIVELTQAHLERFFEAGRRIREQQAEELGGEKTFSIRVWVAVVKGPGSPVWAQFWIDYATRRPGQVSASERYGMIVKAAIKTGALLEPKWSLDDVGRQSPALVKWVASRIDAVYIESDKLLDLRNVLAAGEAQWFESEPAIGELDGDQIKELSQACEKAYKAATQIDPE